MPPPATTNELLDLIQRSGVTDEAKLRAHVQKLTQSSSLPTEPAKLAGVLVRDGLLTLFQAEQLLQGKYKRFTIGKYKVLEKLGAGGMAQVFLCEHKLMRRRVAIKVLPAAKADDPSSLERFYREARAVAALDHPNIVRAYDIDQDENLHFLVMEYVDGTNLHDLVKKFGPLDILRACHYIYGAAVGLQHAHEMGLVHRDIKPGNILVDRAGVVKILDMGLARFFHDEDDVLTKKYDENVLGTADYLAPEQALESHGVDIRADIYALGATFYFLLTASAVFPEGSVAQKLIWHQSRQPRSIKALRPEIPDDIVAVVEKMMAKAPEKRYQTPAELMAALAGYVTSPIAPPADRELPQISLAAGGGANRAPATMVGATAPTDAHAGPRRSSPDAPTLPPGAYPTSTPPPVTPTNLPVNLPPSSAGGHPAVWESLDDGSSDPNAATTDTADRTAAKTPSPRRRDSREPPAPRPRRVRYIAGAVVALAAAAGVYFAFFNKGSVPDPRPPVAKANRITVTRAGGDNTAPTLRDALSKAVEGDTIVITETKLVEPYLKLDRVKHRNISIEGVPVDGKFPVIEANSAMRYMLEVTDVEGFRVRNLEFDGAGKAEGCIQLSGFCPSASIDSVTCRGMKVAGFRFSNAAGVEGRAVVLDHVRVLLTSPTQTGVVVFAAGVETKRVAIQNGRFEGNGSGTAVRIEGAAADLDLTGNRFFNLDTALSFAAPPTTKTVKARVASNTVYQAKRGLFFDLPVPPAPPAPPLPAQPPMGTYALSITQNYFAKTPAMGVFTGPVAPAGVTTADNAFLESAAGNFPVNANLLASPQLVGTDPANDATFLRFATAPPEVAGKKIGAP